MTWAARDVRIVWSGRQAGGEMLGRGANGKWSSN